MFQEMTAGDAILLQSACQKIVAYGETVGVNPTDMISFLKQGATVGELLEFLVAKSTWSN